METKPVDNNVTEGTEQESLHEKKQERNFLQTAQSGLTLIIGLAGLLTASGFIVVNLFLSSFTDIHVYDVNPAQYLAASIGALIFSILIWIALLIIVLAILFGEGLYGASRGKLSRSPREFVREFFSDKIIQILKFVLTEQLRLRDFMAVILSVVLFSYAYGALVYPHVPRFLGGGQPIAIAVIFKDAKDLAAFGFTPVNADHPDVVAAGLLAEVSDGILVYRVANGHYAYAAVIKNDEIKGILDLKSLENSGVYFAQKATETPVPTAAITATSEAIPATTP